MKANNIAILGATSHIAKGLIWSFLFKTDNRLYLFARNGEAVNFFLKENNINSNRCIISGFESFNNNEYDVIINCVGIADPKKQKEAGSNIFFITETYDNMVLNYLTVHSDSVYINFSSGAVYGTSFSEPVNSESSALVNVNDIKPVDYYRIAKLNSEAKHRASSQLKIIDLRVFSYFSRFVDLKSSFLMTDIVNAIKTKTVLKTNNSNIIRDYIHIDDLYKLINCCMEKTKINDVFDAYSKTPVTKLELLQILNEKYMLEYIIDNPVEESSATGMKNIYCSENNHAKDIGYKPDYSSLDAIINEMDKILKL